MATYRKINPIQVDSKLSLDELKLNVSYSKGDYNSKRGVYVHVIPTHREKRESGFMCETCIPIAERKVSGFRVCLRELSRKNQKVEDEIAAKVEGIADKAAELWNDNKFEEVAEMLRSL